MRKFGHYLANIAGIVLAFCLYGVLQSLYFFPKRVMLRYHLRSSSFTIVLALASVLILGLILWLYKKQLQAVNNWGFNQAPHWQGRKLGVALIGFILIALLGNAILRLVSSSGSTVSQNQLELEQLAKQSGQLFKILVVFIAPVCEETIFRGMFFNTFFTKATPFNKWAGIVVSGFVFAYMHDPRITKFILVYWVLGCCLAWVYMQTKDLRYSILTHMCYNALSLI